MIMFLIKTAFDNIVFNKKRNIFSILLIAIASASIILLQGYVEYSKQGMALGFIAKSGNLQIGKKGSWDILRNGIDTLNAHDITQLRNFCAQLPETEQIDAVLEFNGIIGTQNRSSVFWGVAYDNPQTAGITAGTPLFADDQGVILGETLFNALSIDLNAEHSVNLMTSNITGDISVGSFDVTGYLTTGNVQTDSDLVITSRKILLDLFELDDTATCIRLFLKNDADLKQAEHSLHNFFREHNLDFETRNWKQLNPMWEQINGLNTIQFSVVSAILCILIFVSLTQSLSANFMERIGEFGTMEAIGLKKTTIIWLLVIEVCLLSVCGILLGILIAQCGNLTAELLHIKWTPPGYNQPYVLHFYITAHSIGITQFFIFITCLTAIMYPIYTVKKQSSISLMHYTNT